MNTISRTITGGILIILGLILVVISSLTQFISLIYGILLLIIGAVILFNKKEDEIEQRKDVKRTERRKND